MTVQLICMAFFYSLTGWVNRKYDVGKSTAYLSHVCPSSLALRQ